MAEKKTAGHAVRVVLELQKDGSLKLLAPNGLPELAPGNELSLSLSATEQDAPWKEGMLKAAAEAEAAAERKRLKR